MTEPRLACRWLPAAGARLDRLGVAGLAQLGAWVADRERRVAYHMDLHELAALLDRCIDAEDNKLARTMKIALASCDTRSAAT